MFSVTVRDHMMIAHSLRGAVFGPAQRLHGATYVVDATFRRAGARRGRHRRRHRPRGRGAARRRGRAQLPQPRRRARRSRASNTTTEVLARVVADRLADRVRAGELGDGRGALDGHNRDAARVARRVGELRAGAVTAVHVIVPEGIDDPARPSGGNTYDRRVCGGLAALGWTVREHAVPGRLAAPGAADHAALARAVARIPDGASCCSTG